MDCQYCGESAGFLRRKHPECEEKHDAARASAVRMVCDAACDGKTWEGVVSGIKGALEEGRVPASELRKVVFEGMDAAEKRVFDDEVLEEEEERHVHGFLETAASAGYDGPELERIRVQLGKGSVIRKVLAGTNPRPMMGDVTHGFRLMKSESLVWLFEGVGYEITKARVRYTGSSRGVGFRVAKGVYLRTGGFKGERYVEEERHMVDQGQMAITTKHVYFGGGSHRFRVRHDRVVAYNPLPDGFELTRDRANARPERFYTGDGWFAMNLLMNAEDLA